MSEKLRMLKLKCFYCEMENSTETAQLKNWEFFLFYCFKDTKFFFHIYIEQSGGNELYCRAEMYTIFSFHLYRKFPYTGRRNILHVFVKFFGEDMGVGTYFPYIC